MAARVVLVFPTGSSWVPGQRDITPVANRMPPLGLLSLAAYLEQQGHEVRVHDCLGPAAPRGRAANVARILEHDPDLVGFSATTSAFPDAAAMAALIKQARPGVRTVVGGVHAAALGASLLDRFPDLDVIATGEGEAVLAELADGQDPATIAGLAWRDGGAPVRNAPRAHLPELDALPFPAYHLLPGFPREYTLPLFSYIRGPGATMITSRGCPYQCTYCDRSVFGRSYRYNSAGYILEHLRFLRRRHGVRHVNFYDDLFTTHRRRITELCEQLAREDLGLQFNCAVRVGHADPELLALLARAGGLMVSVGIESGDPALLERHKAGVTLEQVRETVARAHEAGLRVKGLFIIGLPGDTEASIRRTGEFARSLDLDDLNYTKFTPFPGAPVWETIAEDGEFIEDWERMNCLNFVFRPRDIDSFDRLEALYNDEVRRFYASPAWRRKFRRRMWQHRDSLGRLVRHLPSFLAARRQFTRTGPPAPDTEPCHEP